MKKENLQEPAKAKGVFTVRIVSPDGVERKKVYENTITDKYFNEIVKRIGDSAETNTIYPTYIAIGDDGTTVAESDTVLGNETSRKAVTSRAAGALGGSDQKSATCYATWDAGEAEDTHLEAGVFMEGSAAADSGVLISHVNINEVVGALDALFIDWKITFANA